MPVTAAMYDSVSHPINSAAPPAGATPMPPAGSARWGVIFTTIVAGLTFGILPALVWPERFRKLAAAEAERMHDVISWARAWGAPPAQISTLQTAGRRIEASTILSVVPIALAAFVAVTLLVQGYGSGTTWDHLADLTYRFHDYSRQFIQHERQGWSSPTLDGSNPLEQLSRAVSLHALWCVLLSVAYLAHWAQVGAHRANVRRFVRALNTTMETRGMMPIRLREGTATFWPLAVVAAFLLVQWGAWWGIPMLLAGAAQRRYILTTSQALQVQLNQRMAVDLPRATVARRCQAEGCRAMLPLPAKFCPQCGRSVPPRGLDEVG
jgi:hypothetical protein